MQQLINGKNNHTPNHTSKLGNKQFVTYLKSQARLSPIIYNIQKYLSAYHPFYYNAFLSIIKGKDLQTLEIQLQAEYNQLLQKKSFLHKINNAVFSRNKCIQKIQRELSKVESVLSMFKKVYYRRGNQQDNIYLQYTKEQGYTTVEVDETIQGSIRLIKNLLMDLSQLREMTLYIIQTVHRWRVFVQEWMDKCQNHLRVDFFIQGKDEKQVVRLYDIIKTDTDFIWKSRLSQHIWFQFKNDPLLIRNVINVSEREQKQILEKYFIQFLYPSTDTLIDKVLKAIDMMNHVYKPKQLNLYEEEEKLIENYLSMQRKNNQQIGLDMDNHDDEARAMQLLRNPKKGDRLSRVIKSNSQSKISVKKELREEIQQDHKKWIQGESPYTKKSPGKKNSRGWVFGNMLKKPTSDRVRQIIKRHEVQMTYLKNHKGIIKPFSVTNYDQKKSIALAYLSQKNNTPIKTKEDGWIYNQSERSRVVDKKKNYNSEGQDKNLEVSRKKMYQSLVKINQTIFEDPKEHEYDQEQDTPKMSKREKIEKIDSTQNTNILSVKKQRENHKKSPFHKNESSRSFSKDKEIKEKKLNTMKVQQSSREKQESSQVKIGKQTIDNKIKFNSIFDQEIEGNAQNQIEIQEQETPLNFRQFIEVFRANTNQTKKQKQAKDVKDLKEGNEQKKQAKEIDANIGSSNLRQIIGKRRANSLKKMTLLPYYSKKEKSMKKEKANKNQSIKKSQSIEKSDNSFKSYMKVSKNQQSQKDGENQVKKDLLLIIDNKQFLNLRPKQITKDIIQKYVKHICNQIPVSGKAFTNYHTPAYQNKMVTMLEDPMTNSLIFDIEGEKDGKVGQAVIIESISATLKMRYTIQFINVLKFQLLVNSVCKISEELLSTSPCEEVILKLTQDKADPVSVHFINLIDENLKVQAEKFSFFHILQKSVLGLSNQSLYERVYIFQSKKRNYIKQAISEKFKGSWKKRVAGSNYRSLVFQTKSIAITSNFKLRSDSLKKPMIEIYKQQSIGLLFVMIMKKIITKYHLKHFKMATLSTNDSDETVGLIKKSPFVRSIFYNLLDLIKRSNNGNQNPQLINWMQNWILKFSNMTDLLNYFNYQQYDKIFKFDFLTESRFILNHELTLCQVNLSTSLDFLIQNSLNMLILNNHHRYTIQEITRLNNQNVGSSFQESGQTGYLLPTTEQTIKLFFMSASQYYSCSDSLDLFSYLELFFRQCIKKERVDIDQMVIPDLTKRQQKVNSVKMYDGFLRIFPERQFYSGSMMKIENLWQNFYDNAVMNKPKTGAIIIEYPIIVGFYNNQLQSLLTSMVFKEAK